MFQAWQKLSLGQKFSLATLAGFLVSLLVFVGLFLLMYRQGLEQERAEAARQVNRLLQSSLENAMLKRDLPGLLQIIRRLGEQPNIRNVFITDPKGQIRFATDEARRWKQLDDAATTHGEPKAVFVRDADGHEVLRSLNPVHNRPPCQPCHGPVARHPINGVLVVDYEAASIRRQARNQVLKLMGTGALIVVLNLIGGWWFIRRFILRPVADLDRASAKLAAGDFDARVKVDSQDELGRLGRTFNDMAGRIQQQMTRLEENRAFLQGLVDAIPDGVRVIDEDFRMVLVNRAFRDQVGSETLARPGESCHRAAHGLDEPCPDTLVTCPVETIGREGKPLKVVHHHRRCDGSRLDVEIYAAPMAVAMEGEPRHLVVESIRDLSAEVRFTHEQRLSELGRLAAGVAHEIYNPLSSMKLALSQIAGRLRQAPDDTVELLDVLEEEMEQCIRITNRLLRLSSASQEADQLVDMVGIVDDTLSLLQWEAEKDGIEVRCEWAAKPLRVLAAESDMRMLVLNIIQNAFHAMPGGGRLAIRGRTGEAQVILEFEDSGVGIDPKDLGHIFMPFFSRRADGVRGTGLGLAICRAIVEQLGGRILVTSEPGQGSCFTVELPRAGEEA